MASPLRETRRALVGATAQGGSPIGAPEHVAPFIVAASGAGPAGPLLVTSPVHLLIGTREYRSRTALRTALRSSVGSGSSPGRGARSSVRRASRNPSSGPTRGKG